MSLKGIDISSYQTEPDFNDLKSKFDFVIARCGTSLGTDPQFSRNCAGLRSSGQLHGFYWYAYPSNSPIEDADNFVKTLGTLTEGELYALDFEESYATPVSWCLQWLQEFERMTGYKALLYINLALVRAHDWTPVIQNNTGLWLAEWDFNPDGSVPSIPWTVCALRQYSDKINYNGQLIDGDVFYGDSVSFINYGYKTMLTQDQQNVLNFLSTTPLGTFGNEESLVRAAVGALNDLPELQQQVSTKQTTIDNLNSEIVTLQASVTTLNAQVATLQGTVAQQNTTISSLQTQIQALSSTTSPSVPTTTTPSTPSAPISLWQKIINFLFKP